MRIKAQELTHIIDYEELLKNEKMQIASAAPPKSPTNSSKEEALDVSQRPRVALWGPQNGKI